MAVQIVQLMPGVIGYKLSKYQNWTAQAAFAGSKPFEEWDGVYIAETTDLACGYAGDYADEKGNGSAFLFNVHLLQATPMVVCDDVRLGDGSISGTAKAEIVRQQIRAANLVRISDNPIMPALGFAGHFYKGLHDDEGNMEIVVPNYIAARINMVLNRQVVIKNWAAT